MACRTGTATLGHAEAVEEPWKTRVGARATKSEKAHGGAFPAIRLRRGVASLPPETQALLESCGNLHARGKLNG